MVTANPILDDDQLALIGYEHRFDLLDASGNIIGQPQVLEASAVQVNTTSKTLRTISGVSLTSNTWADINPFTDRLRPSVALGDGTVWPLGVFVFSDSERFYDASVYPVDLTLADLSALVDQKALSDVSFPIGTPIVPTIISILVSLGVPFPSIVTDASDSGTIAAAVTWPADTSFLTIVAELAQLGGYFTPYFDNSGRCIIRRPQPIFTADADLFYQPSGTRKVAQDSVKINDGILTAENTVLVIDTAPKAAPISAVAYVNPALPWSKENRNGYRVTKTIRTQGLGSQEQAQSMANAEAVNLEGFSTVTFASRPDPRHDAYMLIGWAGVIFRELGWTYSLKIGQVQGHTISQGGFPAIGNGDL